LEETFKEYMEQCAKIQVNIILNQPRPLYDLINLIETEKKKKGKK